MLPLPVSGLGCRVFAAKENADGFHEGWKEDGNARPLKVLGLVTFLCDSPGTNIAGSP